MLGRVFILVLSMAWLCSPVFAKDVIAVLEPSGPLDRSILMKLSDESRAAAVIMLPKDDYRVITRENMVLILRDMGVDPSCVEGECEVETGRNVGAKYVISGSVIHVRNTWMFTLKLHETDKGALLGTSEARGPDELALIDKVQEATRALIGRAILGDERARAVGATARAPVASHSPSQASSSVDFGSGGGGLGVAAQLRQQRCDETAKVDGEKARAARLATAEQGAQSKARTAWSGQSAELEMCASLKRTERNGCIEAVNAWLGEARAMVVSIPAGVEPIETKCGTREPVYEAVERTVVASDVKVAEMLLTRLQSADSMGGGGVAVSGSTNSIGMSFVTISPGSFVMGCTAEQTNCGDDEKPAHTVTLSRGFEIQTTEVTQGQYRAVRGTNPSWFSSCGSDCPVEKVSWVDAIKFANALSKKEGLSPAYSGSGDSIRWDKSANGYRLPTEAEWEYAARAGKATRYSGSNEVGDVAWTGSNSSSKTHKVGTKKANAWGLHDMSGNVWEWCWDWYGKSYYRSSSGADPVGATSGDYRVSRGGAWIDNPTDAGVAYRYWGNPSYRFQNRKKLLSGSYGLRLLRTSP